MIISVGIKRRHIEDSSDLHTLLASLNVQTIQLLCEQQRQIAAEKNEREERMREREEQRRETKDRHEERMLSIMMSFMQPFRPPPPTTYIYPHHHHPNPLIITPSILYLLIPHHHQAIIPHKRHPIILMINYDEIHMKVLFNEVKHEK